MNVILIKVACSAGSFIFGGRVLNLVFDRLFSFEKRRGLERVKGVGRGRV